MDSPQPGRRFVVCGDNPLTLRLVIELSDRYDGDVTVVMPGTYDRAAPQIADLPGVRVVVAPRIDAMVLRDAGIESATCLGLLAQDDVGNVDTALLAQELVPGLRLVVRMFNMNLGENIRQLLHDCVVLSDADMAAPTLAAAALGEGISASMEVGGRRLVATRREQAHPDDIVCGLAITDQVEEPVILPTDENLADLVLAMRDELLVSRPFNRRQQRLRLMSRLLGRRLRLVLGVLLAVLVVGAVVFKIAGTQGNDGAMVHMSWWQAWYEAILTSLAGANPDLSTPWAEKVAQVLLSIAGIAFVPAVTAAVVEAVVKARLELNSDGLSGPISNHVVVIGLGNVGARVIRALHEQGVEVVAVDKQQDARGVQTARELHIPLVFGDAGRRQTLQAASVETCRALLVLSTDDVTNLETALLALQLRADLRVVLRLFDGDFASRVQQAFGITMSRSVSYLAAPAFAAAMLDRQVIGAIPVKRRVLLIAELPIGQRSRLEGAPLTDVDHPNESRLLALRTGRGAQTLWRRPRGRNLLRTDRIVVATTRAGFSRLLALSAADPSVEAR